MEAITAPPTPPGWWARKGVCRFCAGEIREWNGTRHVLNTAKRWHDWPEHPCRHLWALADDPAYARVAIWLRDRGVCSTCGADTKGAPPENCTWDDVAEGLATVKPTTSGWAMANLGAWDVGHVAPLWRADRAAPDALRFWMPGNLTTACRTCAQALLARRVADLLCPSASSGVQAGDSEFF